MFAKTAILLSLMISNSQRADAAAVLCSKTDSDILMSEIKYEITDNLKLDIVWKEMIYDLEFGIKAEKKDLHCGWDGDQTLSCMGNIVFTDQGYEHTILGKVSLQFKDDQVLLMLRDAFGKVLIEAKFYEYGKSVGSVQHRGCMRFYLLKLF